MISLHRLMPLDNQKIMPTLYAHVNTYYQNVSNKLVSLPVDFVYPVFFFFLPCTYMHIRVYYRKQVHSPVYVLM